ncbi:MAG: amino acid ABC transporter permease, partial [Bacillota bacterium]
MTGRAPEWRTLYSPWYNALLTLAAGAIVVAGGRAALAWAVRWAQWDVLGANLRLFLVGTYPLEQAWRVRASLLVVGVLAVLTAGVRLLGRRAGRWVWVGRARLALGVAWVLSFPGIVAILSGVRTSLWGGLLVTAVLAVGGIALSFPLGILLALGRRSRLPAIRVVSTLYIEAVRGVPLVTILFMAQILVPIFLPGVRFDKLLRALIGIMAFSAAYVAENVRGGLQGVPASQYEAAYALGLSHAQVLGLVVLPQALRAVVPAIVGQFISLFKDTSLVAIMGIQDLLGIARSVMANPRWLGRQAEVYIFAGAVYWVFTYAMSAVSRR